LVDNVIPLLQQLSDGASVDAAMRRHVRAQSRQLRVLFDETDSFEHPLTRRLRTAVDAAEARHVDVVVDAGDELPDVPDDVVNKLLTPLRRTLEAELDSAHVVVTSSSERLSLSVVCRGVRDPRALAAELGGSVGAEVVTLDDTVWLVVVHPSGDGADMGDRGE
jgi:CTP:molybdopterin cytidylyltransferase MocA